jgi:CheY-like chemotaxis protein/HPt (histidine-containing phosphotransfer) domain-containing protein
VLLVEDNLLNQVLAKKVLTNWGWEVDIADNGNMAIEQLKKRDYDIILMDIQLPEMDGYEATQYIRKRFPAPKCNIPIMAMTAHAMSSEEEKCKKIGMNGYISKPFDQKVLYTRILRLINTSGYHKESSEEVSAENSDPTTSLAHTDLAYLEQLADGNNDFIKEMLVLFIEQMPESLDKMHTYLERKDWKQLRGILHKIKPSLAFVGLKEIEATVKEAEEFSANETNLDKLPGMIQKINHNCVAAIEELNEKLKVFT